VGKEVLGCLLRVMDRCHTVLVAFLVVLVAMAVQTRCKVATVGLLQALAVTITRLATTGDTRVDLARKFE